MPERRTYIEQQAKVIEVHGIDLLAQVEALLRVVTEYQRQAVRLQGTPGERTTDAARRDVAVAIQKRVAELKANAKALSETLDDVERIAGGIERILRSDRSA
jgi:uncharacterized protein YlxW (UPF0749 family)